MTSRTGVYLHSHTHTEQDILLFRHSCRTDAAVTASWQGPTGEEVREIRGTSRFWIQVKKCCLSDSFTTFCFSCHSFLLQLLNHTGCQEFWEWVFLTDGSRGLSCLLQPSFNWETSPNWRRFYPLLNWRGSSGFDLLVTFYSCHSQKCL